MGHETWLAARDAFAFRAVRTQGAVFAGRPLLVHELLGESHESKIAPSRASVGEREKIPDDGSDT